MTFVRPIHPASTSTLPARGKHRARICVAAVVMLGMGVLHGGERLWAQSASPAEPVQIREGVVGPMSLKDASADSRQPGPGVQEKTSAPDSQPSGTSLVSLDGTGGGTVTPIRRKGADQPMSAGGALWGGVTAGGPAAVTAPQVSTQAAENGNPDATTAQQPQAAKSTWSTTGELLRIVGALGLVLALIFGLHWLGRKLMAGTAAGKGGKVVEVLGRTIIGPRQQVMLLAVGRKVLVVGDSGGKLTALSEIADEIEVAELRMMLGNTATKRLGSAASATSKDGEDVLDFEQAFAGATRQMLQDDDVQPGSNATAGKFFQSGSDAKNSSVLGDLTDRVRSISAAFAGRGDGMNQKGV